MPGGPAGCIDESEAVDTTNTQPETIPSHISGSSTSFHENAEAEMEVEGNIVAGDDVMEESKGRSGNEADMEPTREPEEGECERRQLSVPRVNRRRATRPLGGGSARLNLRPAGHRRQEESSSATTSSSRSVSDEDLDVNEMFCAMKNEIKEIRKLLERKETSTIKPPRRRGRFKDIRPASARSPDRTRLLVGDEMLFLCI